MPLTVIASHVGQHFQSQPLSFQSLVNVSVFTLQPDRAACVVWCQPLLSRPPEPHIASQPAPPPTSWSVLLLWLPCGEWSGPRSAGGANRKVPMASISMTDSSTQHRVDTSSCEWEGRRYGRRQCKAPGWRGLVVAAVHITAASWHTPHTAVCTLAHTTHSCLHHHGVQLLPPGWPHGSVFLLLRQEFHQLLPVLLTPCQHHTQSWVVIQYTVEALGCGGEGRGGGGLVGWLRCGGGSSCMVYCIVVSKWWSVLCGRVSPEGVARV